MGYALTHCGRYPKSFICIPATNDKCITHRGDIFLSNTKSILKFHLYLRFIFSSALSCYHLFVLVAQSRPFSFRILCLCVGGRASYVGTATSTALRDPILMADKSLPDLIWRITATIQPKRRQEKIFRPTFTDIFIWHLFWHLFLNCFKKMKVLLALLYISRVLYSVARLMLVILLSKPVKRRNFGTIPAIKPHANNTCH